MGYYHYSFGLVGSGSSYKLPGRPNPYFTRHCTDSGNYLVSTAATKVKYTGVVTLIKRAD